ncbi:MAG: hypothetical protein FJ098_07210, partial [Deltaproteobacteria bacterium]|nr:hypothetical protein [Deltaproteobacteria bacterium]
MVLGRRRDLWPAPGGVPLDRLVRERCALSWTQARRLVRSGKVHVDGALV